MNTNLISPIRHPAEARLLQKALDGDPQAANNTFQYLSSASPYLRQILIETLHDLVDERLWRHLLRCLALQHWDDLTECNRAANPEASLRIDQSITEAYTKDESKPEKVLKENILADGLKHSDERVRYAAAYVLGLRGNPIAIPGLEAAIRMGDQVWQLRAIHAISFIKSVESGKPLVQALAMDRDILHRAAQSALHELGQFAIPAWEEALNHANAHIRWHAARGLGEIGDTRCVDILAEGLYDENQPVRWATARVLAQIGPSAVPAILKGLCCHDLNELYRQAVYHALHAIVSHHAQEQLKPLLDALHGPAAGLEAPLIAQQILSEWAEPLSPTIS